MTNKCDFIKCITNQQIIPLVEGGKKTSRAFDKVPWKSQQYKNSVFNYQLILADMSHLQHIRGLQRETRLLDGTSPWMELYVCFACSWVFLKNLTTVDLLLLKVILLWTASKRDPHNRGAMPKCHALPSSWPGFNNFISGEHTVSMYSIIKVLPICLLPKQYKILLFSIIIKA